MLKNPRFFAWESDSRNRFWTFLGCPKLKSPRRLSGFSSFVTIMKNYALVNF
jgi:hypothetical protein